MQGRASSLMNAISLLGAFLAASMVLGVLGAGLFMPVTGIAGTAVKSVIGSFDSLPAEFTAAPLEQQTRILDSTGKKVIATLSAENRQAVAFKNISPWMKRAQLAIEDDRYYEHGGIDARGIVRAFASSVMGQQQGASTITQQFVRQTLYNQALREGDASKAEAAIIQRGIPGIVRKIQEAKYAIALERQMSKDDIFEGYLNIAFYGGGAYGVEAASQRFFGIPAAKLNLGQSALLAGLVQRPTFTNPLVNPAAAKNRRNQVLKRMNELGLISAATLTAELKKDLGLKPTPAKMNCSASSYPYLCNYLQAWLLDQPSLGKTLEDRQNLLFKSGVQIRTTFDLKVVDAMQQILSKRDFNSTKRGAAAAVVQPGTGRIIGFAQSSDYKHNQVIWPVQTKYGGSAGFQIGSTAKMFALVEAIRQGYGPGWMIDAPPNNTRYSAERLMNGENCGFTGSYAPANAEANEHGLISLQEATSKSVNTAFLEINARLSICRVKAMMKTLGFEQANGDPYGEYLSSVVLGADNATPVDLAASYATLPAFGEYCSPTPVDSITGFDGTKYAVPSEKDRCRVAIDSDVAYGATKILQTVFRGTAAGVGQVPGHPSAGKTGTSDSSKQTWFAGYTAQLAGAVWYGTPFRPRSMGHIYGATIAGPLWRRIMTAASAGMPRVDFHQGDLNVSKPALTSSTALVPDVTGRSRNAATALLEGAGFQVRVSSTRERSRDVPWGRVVRTSPLPGDVVAKNSTIVLTLSSGSGITKKPSTSTSPGSSTSTSTPPTKSTTTATKGTTKPTTKPTGKTTTKAAGPTATATKAAG